MLEQEKLQGRLSRLKNASEGLFYPSDVDEPFTVFNWKVRDEPPLEKERVREILQLSAHDPIQVKKLDDLFGRLTTPQEWHTDEDLDTVEQFQELTHILRKNLKKIQVFYVGTTEKVIYLVGKTPEKYWAGLKTRIVD